MTRPTEALERALLELTVGSKRAALAKQLANAQNSGGECAQHVKILVASTAGKHPQSIDFDVTFPQPFIYAPNQSTDSLPEPHFSHGIELTTAKVLPDIKPYLLRWKMDDSARYTGAVIRISAYIPNAPKLQKFTATLHLTFYGWAAPTEVEDESTDG